jgi:hypothetical protein
MTLSNQGDTAFVSETRQGSGADAIISLPESRRGSSADVLMFASRGSAEQGGVQIDVAEDSARDDWKRDPDLVLDSISDEGGLGWALFEPQLDFGSEELVVLACGFGGLDEMAACLDDSMVAFALIRIRFGTGRLQRSKLVFIHFSGDDAPAVRRGRVNALKTDVVRLISHAHAYLTAHLVRDVSIATILNTLHQVLVLEDNEDADFITVKGYVQNQELAEKTKLEAVEIIKLEQIEAKAASRRKRLESDAALSFENNPHAIFEDRDDDVDEELIEEEEQQKDEEKEE